VRRGPSRFVRSRTWSGLEAGDPCEVAGTTFARKVKPRWKFAFHVFDRKTGRQYIEVIGGKPGHELSRAFDCELVTPISQKKRRTTA
jgi:hypothetical protein